MEELIKTLGGNGPAWTLVGILLFLCWTLIKMLLTEKDKRIEDARKSQDDIAVPIKYIGEAIKRIEDKTLVAKGEK